VERFIDFSYANKGLKKQREKEDLPLYTGKSVSNGFLRGPRYTIKPQLQYSIQRTIYYVLYIVLHPASHQDLRTRYFL
jgi:hypothetical protein